MSEPYKETLLYWIQERYDILLKKQDQPLPPWSDDPVFQTTYFCNVHRENDKVTKWIRENWSPQRLGWDNYEYAMVLARFLNWPDTLEALVDHNLDPTILPEQVEKIITNISSGGAKVWGNAYVITSHGMPMQKSTYLCQHLLPDVYRALPAIRAACRGMGYGAPSEAIEAGKLVPKGTHAGTCGAAAAALQRVPGIGSFLAGQIVADLKNTVGHPLHEAVDKQTFVVHGPGSLRGLSWFHYGVPDLVTRNQFNRLFTEVRIYVDQNLNRPDIPYIDNQDLQNDLCEYDKYCRIKTGVGRSKRKYHGY